MFLRVGLGSLLQNYSSFFFVNDPAPTEIYTLSLHDALPICDSSRSPIRDGRFVADPQRRLLLLSEPMDIRSEEHTSELQSRRDLVCRLLLEKKNIVL